MNPRSKIPLFILLGLIGIVGSLSVLPQKQTLSKMDPNTTNMLRAKSLAEACKGYSNDNGGKPPPTLFDPGFVEDFGAKAFEEHLYLDPETGRRLEWLYFPPERFDRNGAVEVLIASPITTKNDRRVVAFTDFTVRTFTNEEFEAKYPEARPVR